MSDGAHDVSRPGALDRGEVALLRADLADLEAQGRIARSGAFLVTGTALAALLIALVSGGMIFVVAVAVLLSVGGVFSWKSWLEQEDRIAEVRAVLEAADGAPADGR